MKEKEDGGGQMEEKRKETSTGLLVIKDPVDRITYAFWLMEHDTVENYRFQQTPVVRGARSSDARSKITPSAWPTATALNT